MYEDDDAIDLEEDEEPEILDHTQAPAESRPHPMLGEDNDDMLTAALTASLRTGKDLSCCAIFISCDANNCKSFIFFDQPSFLWTASGLTM